MRPIPAENELLIRVAACQFRAEVFNLTNTASFGTPGTNIDTASGGVVTSTVSAPLNIQFGMKLNF